MANFYISDTHFGCCNSYENRTLEHDKLIKYNWNTVVTNSDTVYMLGDIGRIGNNKDNEYLLQILATLKGKKILIAGNHDKLDDARIKQLFTEICNYKEVTDNVGGKAYKLVLSHYPILMWNGQHKGTIHLYGHTHMTEEDKFFQDCLTRLNDYFADKTLKGRTDCPPARAYNVGAMLIDYTPKTLDKIIGEVQ